MELEKQQQLLKEREEQLKKLEEDPKGELQKKLGFWRKKLLMAFRKLLVSSTNKLRCPCSVIVALTGLPIGYSVSNRSPYRIQCNSIAPTGLPIGCSLIHSVLLYRIGIRIICC